MLQHSIGSRGQAALRMAGAAALALLVLGLNVAWSIFPHRKPHPADMTQRATAAGPLLPVSRKHPPAAAASPPIAAPTPAPRPKPAAAAPAAVAQASPRPTPPPPPRPPKHAPADMTLRATAVGPLMPVKPRHPAIAAKHRAIAPAHVETDAEIAAEPPPEPAAPAAEEIRRIGIVRVIGTGGTFLLIEARDSDVSADLPSGTELRCRGSAATGGAQTASLRVSPERRAPFIVADIVSGSPQVGDGVYLPDTASPPR